MGGPAARSASEDGRRSPALTREGHPHHWSDKAATAEIDAQALSTTAVTTKVARDDGSVPSNGFIRFRVVLGGTSPKAHIRIWATGRSEN